MKRTCIIFILFIFVLPAIAGGGWPQPEGSGYYKLSQNWIISPSFYGPAGNVVPITTTSIFITSFYGEHGITDRLTGIVYLPFFVRNTLNEVRYNQSGQIIPGDELNSIGDADIALKYGIIVNKPVVVSMTALFGLPLGDNSGGDSQILQSGDGEFNQMIRADVSGSLPSNIFLSAHLAFNNRTRGFSDEFRYGAEVGCTFFKKLIAIAKLSVVESLYNGSGGVAENGIFSNNTEYISPTLEVGYKITEAWGISGSGGFAFSGRNILASPNWGVGVFLQL